MHKKIADSSASLPLGNPVQKKLFELSSGSYSGRLVALVQTSPTEIQLLHSDAPRSCWSEPVTVVSDAADYSFDCRINAGGDLYIVYSQLSTHYLLCRKLSYAAGVWTVGDAVVINNQTSCFDPSLAIDDTGTLWISWSRYEAPLRRIHVKSSADDGLTWGAGPSDDGDQVYSGAMFVWSRLVADSDSIHVFYSSQDSGLFFRSRLLSGGSWSTACAVAAGTGFTADFDCAVTGTGVIGVAFAQNGLHFRELSNNSWDNAMTLDSRQTMSPQLSYSGNVPTIVYLAPEAGNRLCRMYTDRKSGSFSTPQVIDIRSAVFDSVLLHDASSGTTEDLTAQAETAEAADFYHSVSGCLFQNPGDALFLGLDARFRYARMELSTPGSGGTVSFSYWDGANWKAFTPANGSYDFSLASADMLFWQDYGSIPDDWQRTTIEGQSRLWIRVAVDSTFATGPVGTQTVAASRISPITFRR